MILICLVSQVLTIDVFVWLVSHVFIIWLFGNSNAHNLVSKVLTIWIVSPLLILLIDCFSPYWFFWLIVSPHFDSSDRLFLSLLILMIECPFPLILLFGCSSLFWFSCLIAPLSIDSYDLFLPLFYSSFFVWLIFSLIGFLCLIGRLSIWFFSLIVSLY